MMRLTSSRYSQGWNYKWINAGIRGAEHYTVSFTHPGMRMNIIHDQNSLSLLLKDQDPDTVIPRDVIEMALNSCPSTKLAA